MIFKQIFVFSFWKQERDAVGSGLIASHYIAELLVTNLDW